MTFLLGTENEEEAGEVDGDDVLHVTASYLAQRHRLGTLTTTPGMGFSAAFKAGYIRCGQDAIDMMSKEDWGEVREDVVESIVHSCRNVNRMSARMFDNVDKYYDFN